MNPDGLQPGKKKQIPVNTSVTGDVMRPRLAAVRVRDRSEVFVRVLSTRSEYRGIPTVTGVFKVWADHSGTTAGFVWHVVRFAESMCRI